MYGACAKHRIDLQKQFSRVFVRNVWLFDCASFYLRYFKRFRFQRKLSETPKRKENFIDFSQYCRSQIKATSKVIVSLLRSRVHCPVFSQPLHLPPVGGDWTRLRRRLGNCIRPIVSPPPCCVQNYISIFCDYLYCVSLFLTLVALERLLAKLLKNMINFSHFTGWYGSSNNDISQERH